MRGKEVWQQRVYRIQMPFISIRHHWIIGAANELRSIRQTLTMIYKGTL